MPEGQKLIQSIVHDEESLLSGITQVLAEHPIIQGAKDDSILVELERIRKEIPGAKAEDKGALLEQYDRQAIVLEQLRKGRQTRTVDPASPYFAHMRLTEGERSRDLFLGKADRPRSSNCGLAERAGFQIVLQLRRRR
jgi:hypothetical protein